MLQLTFEPTDGALQHGISGLSRGHLTVRNGTASVTSTGRVPDQSMKVFLALVALLDGLRQFLQDEHQPTYEFVGNDSSFWLTFTRTPTGIRVRGPGRDLGTVPEQDLTKAVWQGATAFLDQYEDELAGDDIIRSDLADSTMDYATAFDLRR